jgi:chromate transporter
VVDKRPTLWEINRYFLILGATGFGGPVALANYMRRDLAEQRRWLSEEEYDRGLAIATACPGPLAYQLGVYCGYITHGVLGGVLVALSFAFAPFLLVTAVAMVYVQYASTDWIRGLLYGIGPVVVALILKACLNLGTKTLRRETTAWTVAALALIITVLVQQELIGLFLAAGALGIFAFKPKPKPPQNTDVAQSTPSAGTVRMHALPFLLALVPAAVTASALDLFTFFFRTGLLVFGSGLVVVSFANAYVVNQYHWMNERTFLDAVAIGLVSPGPVVITATFVGYIVAGIPGALAATVGIFVPSVLFTVAGTPLLLRYRNNPSVQGFVRGVTVAVVGVLGGTAYIVARPVIRDWLTGAVLAGVLLAPRLRKGIPDQVFVAIGAAIGLIAYPLLRPEGMVR